MRARDLRFIYQYMLPASLMNPKPHQFVLLSNRGPIAIGIFDKPPWHKEEKENLFKELDIQIKYGEVPEIGVGIQLSDWDHAEIIKTYVETGNASFDFGDIKLGVIALPIAIFVIYTIGLTLKKQTR